MNPVDTFLTVHHGRTRQALASALPNVSNVLHEDADGVTIVDQLSLMSVMHGRQTQRPYVLVAEFDPDAQVEFAELRRTFSDAGDAQAWLERTQARLIEELAVETDMPLERPIMRTTAHDGRLTFWRSWVVNDVSVLTLACRRLSGRGAVGTVSMAFESWRRAFGPIPPMASYPHRANEWEGWERLTPKWAEPAMKANQNAPFITADDQHVASQNCN